MSKECKVKKGTKSTGQLKNNDDDKWKSITGIVVIISVFAFLTIMGIVYSPAFLVP